MVTKYEFWFDHFQVEFGAHTWRLSSPREYFKMVEYQLHNSFGNGRTRNCVFCHRFYCISYSKLHRDISKERRVWGQEIGRVELKDEIRYSTSAFYIFSRAPKTRYPEVMSFVGYLEAIRKYFQTAAQIATYC